MRRYLLPALACRADLDLVTSPVTGVGGCGLDGQCHDVHGCRSRRPPRSRPAFPTAFRPAATRAEPTLPKPQGLAVPRDVPADQRNRPPRRRRRLLERLRLRRPRRDRRRPSRRPIASLAARPTAPTPTRPAPRKMNGADIFRAAIGLDSAASYWRVDWNTLVDPKVPIAEWTFDTDHNPATGATAWPAGAGVPQRRHRPRTGRQQPAGPRARTAAAPCSPRCRRPSTHRPRSFVVRVPRTVLPVTGVWTVRLAAGLADADRHRLRARSPSRNGAAPGAARRLQRHLPHRSPRNRRSPAPSRRCRPARAAGCSVRSSTATSGCEDGQAAALTTGDVSRFAMPVDWAALTAKKATPEPRPTG